MLYLRQPTKIFSDSRPITFLSEGDSYTYNGTWLTLSDYFNSLVTDKLNEQGINTIGVNKGVSGSTSADVLSRVNAFSAPLRPGLASIYVGTNDLNSSNKGTVQASPTPTTTVFTVDAGKGAVFDVNSYLTINGESRKVQSVSTDEITVTSAFSQAPSAGQTVELDTYQNTIEISTRLTSLGFDKQLICVQHYLNYSSLGDSAGTEYALHASLRPKQRNAAYALGAVCVDFYRFLYDRIHVLGLDTQGSYSWHVADSDSHLNAYGQSLLAQYLYYKIPGNWKQEWLTSV